jgi:hypothetical protein
VHEEEIILEYNKLSQHAAARIVSYNIIVRGTTTFHAQNIYKKLKVKSV